MAEGYSKVDSRFFKVFDVDSRSTVSGILTGDSARDERNVAMLLATVNAVNSMVSPQEVTTRILDMLVDLTSADRGLLLLREQNGELRLVVGRARGGLDVDPQEPYSRSVTAEVLSTGASVCIVDAADGGDRELGSSVADMALRTIMCVPLTMKGGTLGVVYVDSTLANKEFGDADLALFEALCQQAAVTLENSRLNRAMIDAERMATLGQMTSMILHDLSSPMTVVDHYAQSLETTEMAREDVVSAAHEIRAASGKVIELLQAARDFARGNTAYTMRSTSLAMLVQTCLGQLMHELKARQVDLNLQLSYKGPVELESHRMDRVLTNLVNNALEAMPDGGRLAVSLEEEGEDAVRLRLSDTGIGIPEDRLATIFQPFVTHGKRSGTGLGLAIVEQIVKNHNGTVVADSVVGSGTTFTIVLPKRQPCV